MKYRIVVRPLALIEILEAYDWYEEKRTGLGSEFLGELEVFYEKLLSNPKIYSYYNKPVREGRINRFPYNIIYEIIGTEIIVYSVFMARQDPAKKRAT